jgi:glycosyltransferase involved in cell wall biosynthesis
MIGEHRVDWFTGLWINRNAKRKRPGDLLWSWQIFVNELQKKHGHKNATLILHTDPLDEEGPNLYEMVNMLGISDNICFSNSHIDFSKMNTLHNVADFYTNISFNEGFGLGTLASLQCGIPIVSVCTGGQTVQVKQLLNDLPDVHNGVAIEPDVRSLVGSQMVPYIYEDYASVQSIADGFMKMYEMGVEGRKKVGMQGREYVLKHFSKQKVVSNWDKSLEETIGTWKNNLQPHWTFKSL